ncbi:MAG: hypothetical protein IPL71_22815, partial [Anaerolineales bacterium]|uniref:hypothetical protein n=1 Tax=Candidatus Villigracilis proximus TaxID=3140683 RepID=UPI0031362F92|nr:hypothetical protein [Anaerolineales bacterium]
VLAFFIYLSQGRRVSFLFLSGITAALAQLTKSSAIAILMPIGILLLIQIFQQRQNGLIQTIWDHTKIFVLWLLVLAGAYFIFWPGMWVAPEKMLYQVYGNAFSYAFQGARLAVTEDLQPTQFSLATGFSGIWDLSTVLLWRTSPLTWLGILLGFISPFILNRKLVRLNWQLPALLFFTAAAFILIFGIAQGRNSPHYILASYLALNLFAALGWFHLIEWFVERFHNDQIKTLKVFFDNQVFTKVKQTFRGCLINLFFDHKVTKSQRLKGKKLSGLVPLLLSGEVIKQPLRVYLSGREVQYASLFVLVFAQGWSAVSYFPYYYTYRNPLLYAAGMYSQAPQFAYGEGLELAAHYLAELPDAKNSTVIAFYARGCFSYFYPGETTRFKPYYVEAGHEADLVNSIRSADYLVLYYATQGHLDKYEPLLATLSSVQPIHEIWLDDYQYVTIYQVDSFPPAVFEAFAK